MTKKKSLNSEEEIVYNFIENNSYNGLTITDLVTLTKKPRSAVRIALAKLEGAGKVSCRKVGMAKIYNLNQKAIKNNSSNVRLGINFIMIFVIAIAFSSFVLADLIHVSNPQLLTSATTYERSPAVSYYSNNYWVMYTKADKTGPAIRNVSYNPDADNYTIYYRHVSDLGNLGDAEESALSISTNTRANGFTQRNIKSLVFQNKLFLFASGDISSPDASIYYYSNEYGEWSGPYLFTEGFAGENDPAIPNAMYENIEVTTDNTWIYVLGKNSTGSYLSTWNTTHYGSNNTLISSSNESKIYYANNTLYFITVDSNNISIYSASPSINPEFSLVKTISSSNTQDVPDILYFNQTYYLLSIEEDSISKFLQIRTSKNVINWTDPKIVTWARYDSDKDNNYTEDGDHWVDFEAQIMSAEDSINIFYASESDATPDFGDSNIFYLDMSWNTTNNHLNTIQNALETASNNDDIVLKNSSYNERIIIEKNISLIGSDSLLYYYPGTTIISVYQGNVSITNLTIGGGATGIHVIFGTQIELVNISHCRITGNTLFGINNEGNGTVFAKYNYWGDIYGPDNMGEGEGDDVSEDVYFSPWFESTDKTSILYDDQIRTMNDLINYESVMGANIPLGLDEGFAKLDLSLIKKGFGETSISWLTNDSTTLTNNGKITRKDVDTNVRLTALVGLADAAIKSSPLGVVTVVAEEETDEIAVNNTLNWLTFDVIKSSNANASNITENLNLSRSGLNYTIINWTSSNESIIDNEGNVYFSNETKNVSITALIYRDAQSVTTQFNFTVIGTSSTDILELSTVKQELTNALILNGNMLVEEIRGSVYLPPRLSQYQDVFINWSSSDISVINDDYKNSTYVVLNYSNFFTDQIETGVYIDRSYNPYPAGDEEAIYFNDMEIACGSCVSAVFDGETELDPEGEFCDHSSNLFPNLILSDNIICLKSDVTNRMYELDFLSITHNGCYDNNSGYCNYTENRTAYIRTDYLDMGEVTRNASMIRSVVLTATLTKNGSNLTKNFYLTVSMAEALATYDSFGQVNVVNDTKEVFVNSTNIGSINSVFISKHTKSTDVVVMNMEALTDDENIINTTNNLTLIRELESNQNHSLFIPENTVIDGGENWNGVFLLPTIEYLNPNATYSVIGSSYAYVDFVFEAGNDLSLNFSKPIKITLENKSGKNVAYANKGNELTQVSTICNSETNPTNINPGDACYIDDGSHIFIWTYHLSKFATYYVPEDAPEEDTGTSLVLARSGGGGVKSEAPSVSVGATKCEEDWNCTSWSECSLEGRMTRECTELNECGTKKDMPDAIRECIRIEEPKEIKEPEETALFDVIIDIINQLINF